MKRILGMVLAAASALAMAQDYPSKPIRILVPFAPGGAVDTSTRILTQKMNERLGWNFVVENRPVGNGFIATTSLQESAPDGSTPRTSHNGECAVHPSLIAKRPYEF